jgi:hypothetical protein
MPLQMSCSSVIFESLIEKNCSIHSNRPYIVVTTFSLFLNQGIDFSYFLRIYNLMYSWACRLQFYQGVMYGFGWLRPAVGVIELSQNIIQVFFPMFFHLSFLHVTCVNICRCSLY